MFIRKISLLIFSFLILGTLSFGGISSAQESPESIAKHVVESFLAAMNERDFDKAVSLVVDTSFSSPDEQINAYKEYSKTRDFGELRIVSTSIANEGSFFVKLEDSLTSSDVREVINVKNYDGQWKIALGDSSKELGKSPDFSTNTLANHFSFTGYQYGDHWTSPTFSIPSGVSNVVVQGWQYSGNQYYSRATYQLAQKTWLGYKEYGSSVLVDYDGEYNITLSGAFEGSGFCLYVFVGNSTYINGAGNVMYNP
jgi:hypothetical protein